MEAVAHYALIVGGVWYFACYIYLILDIRETLAERRKADGHQEKM